MVAQVSMNLYKNRFSIIVCYVLSSGWYGPHTHITYHSPIGRGRSDHSIRPVVSVSPSFSHGQRDAGGSGKHGGGGHASSIGCSQARATRAPKQQTQVAALHTFNDYQRQRLMQNRCSLHSHKISPPPFPNFLFAHLDLVLLLAHL